MKVTETRLAGVLIIEPKVFGDSRGFFKETFDTGLRKTVEWYLSNQTWWQRVLDGEYRLGRLGEGA